jgi:Ran GTPase-activating protein (RanGAP) involved in mRNA processing and transport
MTSIDISQNQILDSALEEKIYQTVHMNKLKIALSGKSLTELDLSGIGFGAEGAPLVAQYISDNGALSVLSLKKNNLGQETDRGGMQALSDMLKGNTVLTDLDMSENYMDPTDAKIFSEGISDNRALTSLDLSQNHLCAEGAKHVADAIKVSKCMVFMHI